MASGFRRLVVLNCVSLLVGGLLFNVSELKAYRGGVRHSTTSTSRGTVSRTTTTRSATRPVATPAASRSSARAGYRTGYRHGSYNSWNNARRDYYRWRTFTGAIKLGVYAATRPKQSTTVVVTGATYYYAGGVYYTSSGSGYVVVAPPPGAVVYAVPTHTTVVHAGTTEYLYVNGAYYVTTSAPAEQPPPPDPDTTTTASAEDDPSDVPMTEGDENYEVVAPPVGATVPYLPEEADEKTINGKKYFEYAGTYYRPFASDGETIYMVVEDPGKAG
jgi:hypothetical protein